MCLDFKLIEYKNKVLRKLFKTTPCVCTILILMFEFEVVGHRFILIPLSYAIFFACIRNYSQKYIRVGYLIFADGCFTANDTVIKEKDIIKVRIYFSEIKGESYLSSRLPVEYITNGANNFIKIIHKNGRVKYPYSL